MKYFLISFSFLILSCSSKMKQQPESTAIQLNVGEMKEIQFEGNPTTGYTWNLEIGDSTLVKVTEAIEPMKKEDERMVGVGSIYKYTIEALKKGETSLIFTYKRVWEKDIPPAKQEEMQVIVN